MKAPPLAPTEEDLPGKPNVTDLQVMLETLQTIERAAATLRRLIEQLQERPPTESEEPSLFSLYGIFAPTEVTWQDFQEAKRGWLKEIQEI